MKKKKEKQLNRLLWHYDAIINGGASLWDCIKVEWQILLHGKYNIFDQ